MSFLEMTKLHLAQQEDAKSLPGIRTSDGHFIQQIVWRSPKVIVFQDSEGHFWRYLFDFRRYEPALIMAKNTVDTIT
jgi:hypothetical protein